MWGSFYSSKFNSLFGGKVMYDLFHTHSPLVTFFVTKP